MSITIGEGQAGKLLEKGMAQAEDLLKNPGKVDELLIKLEEHLGDVPLVGDTLADIPLMISMIKAYITKEYEAVSPKVIACLVGAFIYFVRREDLISDDIPVLGVADDIAVLALALKLCEAELRAFADWRGSKENTEKEAEYVSAEDGAGQIAEEM